MMPAPILLKEWHAGPSPTRYHRALGAHGRLLSASVTCRLQKRSPFAYLSDVLAAKIRGDPIPLLS
jgi:hypothetical protein